MYNILCRGIKTDFSNRFPHYLSDWRDVISLKVLSSTFFIFFTSITPALTFSLYLMNNTSNQIGVIEVLLSTCISGSIFSIFAGQPLTIVGVTGPVSILTASIFSLSIKMGIKFLQFYAWSQIWAATIIIFLSILNACDLVKYLTKFSCEIFSILIALIYLINGIQGIGGVLSNPSTSFDSALLQFIISLGTFYLAYLLSTARKWTLLTESLRELITDYGPTLSIVLWSMVPLLAKPRLETHQSLPDLYVPSHFGTTSGRSWLIDLLDIPVWAIFVAFLPGLILTMLFYFDHNVSSLLAQNEDMKLKKGPAFHLDFLVLGLATLVTGILALPPCNGLLPQAPLHTKSLVVKQRVFQNDIATDRFEVKKVYEQRLSNLAQSLLCGMVCFQPFSQVLGRIPQCVLYGFFLFLAVSSIEDDEFSYRLYFLCIDPKLRNKIVHPYAFCTSVDYVTLGKFTAIEGFLYGLIYGITFTPAGVVFPALISLLVVIRVYLLPEIFSAPVLEALDPFIVRDKAAYEEAIQLDNLEAFSSSSSSSTSSSLPSYMHSSPLEISSAAMVT